MRRMPPVIIELVLICICAVIPSTAARRDSLFNHGYGGDGLRGAADGSSSVTYKALHPQDGSVPGWVYLQGFPNGECDDPVSLVQAYVRDTCIVQYEGGVATSSVRYTCANGQTTYRTTYTDTECEIEDTELELGTEGQCLSADTDDTRGAISVTWFCTSSSTVPVPSGKDYAVGKYYSTTSCSSSDQIFEKMFRTKYCLIDAQLVDSTDYTSLYISNDLHYTHYSDLNCGDDYEDADGDLPSSCSDVDDDDDSSASTYKWSVVKTDDDKSDDDDDDSLSTGAVAGICIAVIFASAVVFAGAVYYIQKYYKPESDAADGATGGSETDGGEAPRASATADERGAGPPRSSTDDGLNEGLNNAPPSDL